MGNVNDFVISKGVLRKYTGSGGVITIPEGVKEIGKKHFRNVRHCWILRFPIRCRKFKAVL